MKKILLIITILLASAYCQHFAVAKTMILTPPSLTTGLVGWWTFDGKNMIPNVRDSSGNGNHGNLLNQTPTTTVMGKIGQGLSFDGIDDVINYPGITTSDSFTISFRINPTTGGGTSYGSLLVDSNGSIGIWFLKTTRKIDYYFAGLDHVNTTALPVNTWSHVSIVNNAGAVTFYLNGVADGTTTSGPSYTIVKTGNDNGGELYRGKLDDIRIYNRAFSAAEITNLYNNGAVVYTTPTSINSGLVGWWTFDGKNSVGGSFYDSGTSFATGTAENISTSTFYKPGKIGQGINFDHVNDRVNFSNIAVVTTANATNTIAFWMNWDGRQIGFGNAVWYFTNYGITMFSSFFGINTFNSDIWGFSTAGLANGWHHMVVEMCNGVPSTCGARMWVDGVKKTVSQVVGAGVSRTATANGRIGDASGNNSNYFGGGIDDFRIYNRSLSDIEVKQLFNNGTWKLKGGL